MADPGMQRAPSRNTPAPASVADLERHPVLAHLTPERQRAVLQHAEAIRLVRQETLFRTDDPARHFFLCRSGQLRLYRLAADGNEKIIGLVDPGDSFAEAAVFMQQRTYPVCCTALRASELVRFDARHLIAMLRESPESCLHLLGVVSRRLSNRVADIEALALQNAQLRIVNYLAQIYQTTAGEAIELPASKKYVAGLLAVQPETLSRILTLLREAGIIRMNRRHIRILDPQRLSAVARGQETL